MNFNTNGLEGNQCRDQTLALLVASLHEFPDPTIKKNMKFMIFMLPLLGGRYCTYKIQPSVSCYTVLDFFAKKISLTLLLSFFLFFVLISS